MSGKVGTSYLLLSWRMCVREHTHTHIHTLDAFILGNAILVGRLVMETRSTCLITLDVSWPWEEVDLSN